MINRQKLTKVFIIDDNLEAVELLQRLLEKNFSVDVVGTATDAKTAADIVIKTEPDIIFLDIELPSMSGLEFCSLIRQDIKPETKVVFYTGHDKYMLDAIRHQAFDYLLKPPTEQDLAQIMTRYYENKLAGIPSVGISSEQLPIILVVNSMNEHTTLRIGDIAYFRYNQERKIWEVVCMNGTIYLLRHRTTADVILNYSTDFIQIHKRFIVNINQIKMIQESVCVLMEPMDAVNELRISKNYRAQLMSAFYSL